MYISIIQVSQHSMVYIGIYFSLALYICSSFSGTATSPKGINELHRLDIEVQIPPASHPFASTFEIAKSLFI